MEENEQLLTSSTTFNTLNLIQTYDMLCQVCTSENKALIHRNNNDTEKVVLHIPWFWREH